jgi:hypothetical protein
MSTEPKTYLNATTGHMIAGGLSVLITSPIFVRVGFPYYLIVLVIPLGLSLARELYQVKKRETSFLQSINDIGEWMFGGVIFTAMIGLSVYLGTF